MIWLACVRACDSIASARVRASLITSSARLFASDRPFWPSSAAASPAAIFFSRSFMAPRMIGQMNVITTQMKMANTSIWTMSVTVIFTRVSSTDYCLLLRRVSARSGTDSRT